MLVLAFSSKAITLTKSASPLPTDTRIFAVTNRRPLGAVHSPGLPYTVPPINASITAHSVRARARYA